MRNLASLLVPCALVVVVGCGPGPTCGADLVYNETTGLCDCLTGGTWGDDGYCRYADGAIALPDGAVPMADAGPDDDGGLPDAGPLDAGVDAAPDACVTSTFYRDADGDGHGVATDSVTACVAPDGYVDSDDDCNDTCETCLPGGTEICTEPALDEDCDGTSNEGCVCANGTSTSCGTTEAGECAFGTQRCVDGAYAACEGSIGPAAEVCNGLDDDCDGTTDEGTRTTFYRDADGDGVGGTTVPPMQACSAPAGYVATSTDCNDACPTCYPGRTEVCDGLDNNCSGAPDEGATTTFYADADDDTYGNFNVTTQACSAPVGYVANSTDCDDTCASCHPGATEMCDGFDNNCVGGVDEGLLDNFYPDCDRDGYAANGALPVPGCAAPSAGHTSCPTGGWTMTEPVLGARDCADSDSRAFPGQTSYFDTAIAGVPATRDFDFNCDNIETRAHTRTNVSGCSGTGSCATRSGWTGSTVPACGASAELYSCLTGIDSMCFNLQQTVPQRCR